MEKLGLVIEGGGMKCAYSAGILDAFLDDNITFDYVIGVSAGAANAASFLAKQRGRNKRFYTEFINDPDYMGVRHFLKTGEFFGLSYIYQTLSNTGGRAELDFKTLKENPAEFVVPATDAVTGKPHYFQKADMAQDDYRVIMASSALPALSRPVSLNGHLYYDGGVTDAIPVDKALADGCDRLVVLRTKPRDFVKMPEGMKPVYSLMCRRYPETVKALNNRHLMYRRCQARQDELEKEGRAFVFAPSNPPKMGTYTRDKTVEEQLYNLGVLDYKTEKTHLFEWLFKKKQPKFC
ncbi:MAG: patatin family protein [Lachnospiraceae bacterium]|nr:patatin family protein [Lachnospiraceae bacterium]